MWKTGKSYCKFRQNIPTRIFGNQTIIKNLMWTWTRASCVRYWCLVLGVGGLDLKLGTIYGTNRHRFKFFVCQQLLLVSENMFDIRVPGCPIFWNNEPLPYCRQWNESVRQPLHIVHILYLLQSNFRAGPVLWFLKRKYWILSQGSVSAAPPPPPGDKFVETHGKKKIKKKKRKCILLKFFWTVKTFLFFKEGRPE